MPLASPEFHPARPDGQPGFSTGETGWTLIPQMQDVPTCEGTGTYRVELPGGKTEIVLSWAEIVALAQNRPVTVWFVPNT